MNAWLLRCAAMLLALSTSGCALFGATEEEPTELEELPVVADDRPFDPSQAVDDDDDLEPWKTTDAQDADAFAGSNSKVTNRAGRDSKETPASGARDRGTAAASAKADHSKADRSKADRSKAGAPKADTSKAGKDSAPGARVPGDEHVAGPREVEQKEQRRRDQFSRIDRERSDDGNAKAEFAANPPAEEVGKSKSTAWTLLDYSLEGTLLLIGASGITALIALARRFPRTVVVAVAFGLAALTVLVGSQSE